MTTMTHPAPTVKRTRKGPRRPAGVSLGMWIGRTHYRVRPFAAEDRDVLAAVLLTKSDGERYTVAATTHGHTCECGDWTFRKAGTGEPCKHIAAAVAWGLLPVVTTIPTATLPDGRVVFTTTSDGIPIDQFAPARFSPAPIEPPVIERPEPRPADLLDATPWYLSAPFDPELDGTFYNLSAPESWAEEGRHPARSRTTKYSPEADAHA